MKVTIKRKNFSRFDATDNLKRMKDSDILAEKARKETDYHTIAQNGLAGGLAVGAAGAGLGALNGLTKKGGGWNAMKKGFTGGAKKGAILGATVGAGYTYLKGRKQAQENRFYNDRLRYAKTQALRREKKDWKTNMTQRDGYSY